MTLTMFAAPARFPIRNLPPPARTPVRELPAGSTIVKLARQYSSLTLGTDSAIPAGAGGDRSLLFVIARSPDESGRRGNLIG